MELHIYIYTTLVGYGLIIWRKEGATEFSVIKSKHIQSKYLAFIAIILD
jgi:hypothetical protein